MKVASITQTKNQLSALLDEVRKGETILIFDRDTPVARIEPVFPHEDPDLERELSRMEKLGLILRGPGIVGELPKPIRTRKGGDILAVLLAEREEGR